MFEKELREIRNNFIKEHNLKCENCQFWEKNRKDKCASKIYCIVRDYVFSCNYKPKENESKNNIFPEITLPEGSAEFVDKAITDAEKHLKESE